MMEPDMRREAGKRVPKSSEDKPTMDVLALAHFKSSLVKYDNPLLVYANDKKKVEGDGKSEMQDEVTFPPVLVLDSNDHCSSHDTLTKKETEEILHAIIPPREWKDENGSVWRQLVSKVPATRQDVINLAEELNRRLKEKLAREAGLCPLRRELYAQCFDELIRQVTITCSERGIMLVRVRDELNMTMDAYETLYESSVAYGLRKALMSESKKSELEAKIVQMSLENGELTLNISEVQAKIEETERKYVEQKAIEEAEHLKEVELLKIANQQMKKQLTHAAALKRRQHK